MRATSIDPELASAARQLQWIALFQALCWSLVPVAFIGAALFSTLGALVPAFGPYGARLFDEPGPFLTVFAVVPSALATSFAQQLRRAISAADTAEPPQVAFAAVALPFITSAIVYARLDRALVSLAVPVARTRGAAFALAPLALLVVGPFVSAFTSDREAVALCASLFAFTRIAWGAMTARACRSILMRASVGGLRAHGDAPVAGG